jgi:RNA recognition motif-containing protein
MNNRLYVGNLSYDATQDSVRECFASCGSVSEVNLLMDRETGRARGFAFVTMSTEGEATNAITQLNNSMFEGRPLRVSVAEERAPRRGPGGGDRNTRGGHRGW